MESTPETSEKTEFSHENSTEPSPKNMSIDPALFELAGSAMIDSSSESDAKTPVFDANSRRLKSSLRIRYEAEVSVIKKKLGGLEAIRDALGLSQRKMCQLLFVDPSAWTRWTRKGEEAPPHIYRMLQWYLALNDKYPALDVNFWLQTVTRAQSDHRLDAAAEIQAKEIGEISDEVDRLTTEIADLKLSRSYQSMPLTKTAQTRSSTILLLSILLNLALFVFAICLLIFR